MKKPSACQAFTLVELLVASVVTTLIAVAATLVIGNVTEADRRIARLDRQQAEARAAVTVMADALRNALRPVSDDEPPLMVGEVDDVGGVPRDRIRFFTTDWRPVRADQPESDVREVAFFVMDPQTGDAPTLVRRLDPTRNAAPDEGGVIERVALGVAALELRYHDGVAWRDEWLEGMGYPTAVRVTVMVLPEDGQSRAVVASRTVALDHGYRGSGGAGGAGGAGSAGGAGAATRGGAR